jgi:hypothetical protein
MRVFGSVGAHAWDADGNATDDDTGVDLTYGVGLRAEYEVLEVGEINLNQTTASAYMLF